VALRAVYTHSIPADSKDPAKVVQRSIEIRRPIIVVTLNYRLNVFAFGDCNSEKNLALSDQRAALEFVRQHIAGFGGDPVPHHHWELDSSR
jgi:carboxylesterase type B